MNPNLAEIKMKFTKIPKCNEGLKVRNRILHRVCNLVVWPRDLGIRFSKFLSVVKNERNRKMVVRKILL